MNGNSDNPFEDDAHRLSSPSGSDDNDSSDVVPEDYSSKTFRQLLDLIDATGRSEALRAQAESAETKRELILMLEKDDLLRGLSGGEKKEKKEASNTRAERDSAAAPGSRSSRSTPAAGPSVTRVGAEGVMIELGDMAAHSDDSSFSSSDGEGADLLGGGGVNRHARVDMSDDSGLRQRQRQRARRAEADAGNDFGRAAAGQDKGFKEKVKDRYETESSAFMMAAKYVWGDTKRHKTAYAIGFFTVFLVVFFTITLQNAISRSPIIFLKLAENQVGEYDVTLQPTLTANTQSFFINYTEIKDQINDVDTVVGSCPRWLGLASVRGRDSEFSTFATLLVFDTDLEREIGLGREWNHSRLERDHMHLSRTAMKAIGVEPNQKDSAFLEIDLLGLASNLGGVDGGIEDAIIEAFLSANTGLDPDAPLTLPSGFTDPFGLGLNASLFPGLAEGGETTIRELVASLVEQLTPALKISKEYFVDDAIGQGLGKFPTALGNVAILEAEYLPELLQTAVNQVRVALGFPDPAALRISIGLLPTNVITAEQRQQLLDLVDIIEDVDNFLDNVQNVDINEYVMLVIAMYTERFTTYLKPVKEMNADLIDLTNNVSDAIGYRYPVTLALPVAGALEPLYFIRLFLDNIFTFVITVMVGLGAMLIYSLLLSNVEEKTYEYGMLRGMGMRQYVLIELLTVQSLSFSLPAIGLALLAAFIAFLPIIAVIAEFALLPEWGRYIWLDGAAIATGVVLGLVMPFVALIGPVRRAMSRTLRDALDLFHQVQSETTVTVIKLENLGLSPWQVTVSLMMVVMGFIVYYVIPYTFTFDELPLFFIILTLILVGLLVGLSFISQTLQSWFERGALRLIMWREDFRQLHHIVQKNLAAHDRRNAKTAIMFTVSLAFIIFSGVSFALQGYVIQQSVQLGVGCDIVVFAPFDDTRLLDEDNMRAYLDTLSKPSDQFDEPLVRGFTFVTPELASGYRLVKKTEFGNLAGFPDLTVGIRGVEENYLRSTFTSFYQVTEKDESFEYDEFVPQSSFGPTSGLKPDLIKSLYTDAGEATLPIESEGIQIPPDVLSGHEPYAGGSGGSGNGTNSTLAPTLPPPPPPPPGGSTESPPPSEVIKTQGNVAAYTEYIDVIMSEALRETASVDTSTPLRLSVDYFLEGTNSSRLSFLCKARGMVRQMPGFFFSSYRQTARGSAVLVSMDAYHRLQMDVYNGMDDRLAKTGVTAPPKNPGKSKLMVWAKENPTLDEIEIIENGLRAFIDDDLTQVLKAKSLIQDTATAIALMDVFFYIVATIAVSLCFFVLWLSFTANVNDNAWEFGVLRALGLNAAQVHRIYIYEALALIMASVLLGTICGTIVAMTLTLQFNLFTQLEFTFAFPYVLFLLVLAMSVGVGILGSYLPARALAKKQIASALKNL